VIINLVTNTFFGYFLLIKPGYAIMAESTTPAIVSKSWCNEKWSKSWCNEKWMQTTQLKM